MPDSDSHDEKNRPETEETSSPDPEQAESVPKERAGSSPPPDPSPPSVESLAILGVNDAASVDEDDEDAPPWHDPMMPLEDRMGLAQGLDFFAHIYASLGQTDCTSCGYDNCKAYARAIHGDSEGDLSLCIPGGYETEEKLHELKKPDPEPDPEREPEPEREP